MAAALESAACSKMSRGTKRRMRALVGSYNDWCLSASSSVALEKHAAAAAEHQGTRLEKWELRLMHAALNS